MFLIVVSHYVSHGLSSNRFFFFDFNNSIVNVLNYITMEPLFVFSTISVNCYVMITGFFMINREEHRWKGIMKIWIQTCFYSVFIAILFMLFNMHDFSVKDFILSFVPIYSNKYWFVTKYLGLMLIAPYLSIIALNITKRQYLLFLVILFILNFKYPYGDIYSGDSSLFWFVFLFLLSGYIKLYSIPDKVKKHIAFITILLLFAISIYKSLYNFNKSYVFVYSTEYHSLIFFLSLSFFILILYHKELKGKFARVLFHIAPYSFGVYLIHDNSLVRNLIWNKEFLLFTSDSYHIPMFLHCLTYSFVIFIICIFIDYIRTLIFKKIRIDYLLDNIISYFYAKK